MPRPSQVAAIVFAAIAAGSVIYAWQLSGRLDQSELARAALEKKQVQLLARISSLEKTRPTDTAAAGTASRGEAGRSHNDASSVPAPADPQAMPPPGGRGNFFARMDTPEMQRLMSIQQKAALDSRFAALFRKLNLSPANLEKFKDLLVEKQSAVMDVMAAARSQGLNPRDDPDQIRQLIASSQAEVDATIRSTLGDSAFQQYEDYEKTMPQRGVANQLDQRLSYTATPLTPDQTEQLVSLMAAAAPVSNAAPATGRAALLGMAGGFGNRGGAAITDDVVNGSQSFLSTPQVDALRQIQQEHQAQAQLRQQMQATRAAAGGATPTPAPAAGTGRP